MLHRAPRRCQAVKLLEQSQPLGGFVTNAGEAHDERSSAWPSGSLQDGHPPADPCQLEGRRQTGDSGSHHQRLSGWLFRLHHTLLPRPTRRSRHDTPNVIGFQKCLEMQWKVVGCPRSSAWSISPSCRNGWRMTARLLAAFLFSEVGKPGASRHGDNRLSAGIPAGLVLQQPVVAVLVVHLGEERGQTAVELLRVAAVGRVE